MRRGFRVIGTLPTMPGSGVKTPEITDPKLTENIFGEKPVNRVANRKATLKAVWRMRPVLVSPLVRGGLGGVELAIFVQ